MSLDSILRGIRAFKSKIFPSKQDHFEALGSGQQPKLLLVTCSDSRIDPAMLTQTEPGEVAAVTRPHG